MSQPLSTRVYRWGRLAVQLRFSLVGFTVISERGHYFRMWFHFGPCESSDFEGRIYDLFLGPITFSFALLPKQNAN